MCDMTHSDVRHDSFKCETWLIHMWDMTHSYVRHDSFRCVPWLIQICDVTMRESKRALFISDRVTAQHRCYRNSHTCVRDTTHSDVKWLIQMCDMTHSDVCHDSFKSVTWLCVWAMCEFHTCVRAIGLFSFKVLKHIETVLYRDSFLHICVPRLI